MGLIGSSKNRQVDFGRRQTRRDQHKLPATGLYFFHHYVTLGWFNYVFILLAMLRCLPGICSTINVVLLSPGPGRIIIKYNWLISPPKNGRIIWRNVM